MIDTWVCHFVSERPQRNLGAATSLPLMADPLKAVTHNCSLYLPGGASVHAELMHNSSGTLESTTVFQQLLKTSLSIAVGPIVP